MPTPSKSLVYDAATGESYYVDIMVPDPDPAVLLQKAKDKKLTEIDNRLSFIDTKSARSLRSVLRENAKGRKPSDADVDALDGWENQAQGVRSKIALVNACTTVAQVEAIIV